MAIFDFFKNDQLSLRLVLASLIIGTVLSIFSTGVQLYTSFERQKYDVNAELDKLEHALAPSLARALWEFNFSQTEIILNGLVADDSIEYVELNSSTGQEWSVGTSKPDLTKRVYNLTNYGSYGDDEMVGKLTIALSLDAIRNRVWAQFWTILASSMLKAYLGAFAFLLVVHAMVIRHLRKIVDHIDNAQPIGAKADLHLERKQPAQADDLDKIALALNDYSHRVEAHVRQIKEEIAGREGAEADAAAKSTFLATMSHEIRTPLNSILGLFQLIEISEDVPERNKIQAATGYKAAHRLLEQMVNVIDVSRLDAEAITIRKRPTSIAQLVEQWEDTTAATVFRHKKDIDVTVHIDPSLDKKYLLDGARLSQILNNLTDNAAKFTQSGELSIQVKRHPLTGGANKAGREGHGLVFSVLDTGIGIDPDDANRVFERFTQLDSGMARKHGGSGLGLSICREIAELMDATLTVHKPDTGHFKTEFQLTFNSNLTLERQHEKS